MGWLSLLAQRVGFDLRCGGGRLGLQHATGMLPSALGFESPDWFHQKQKHPKSGGKLGINIPKK